MKLKAKPLLCTLAVLILCAAGFLLLCYPHTSAARQSSRNTEDFPQVHSSIDKDGDGIDDQSDLLQGALDYIATKPKYKSKYYDTGYPNDEYGVCTDVVGAAMNAAGYDLQALVNQDIAAHPDDYDIDAPDPNIDFRRVKNLRVYFDHTAVSLTTDTADTEQWQGGDIVIYPKHIGMVSDRRGAEGIPYLIHHYSPMQRSYEEDMLATYDKIVGHYRISE